jgi:hypothetical protein
VCTSWNVWLQIFVAKFYGNIFVHSSESSMTQNCKTGTQNYKIDTGSPPIRCNFTTLDFLALFSRNKCFQNKNWFSMPVILKVNKKEERQCGRFG